MLTSYWEDGVLALCDARANILMIFGLSLSRYKSLKRMWRNFIWGTREDGSPKKSSLAWDIMQSSKLNGGVQILPLVDHSAAVKIRQVTKILEGDNVAWTGIAVCLRKTTLRNEELDTRRGAPTGSTFTAEGISDATTALKTMVGSRTQRRRVEQSMETYMAKTGSATGEFLVVAYPMARVLVRRQGQESANKPWAIPPLYCSCRNTRTLILELYKVERPVGTTG
ncbi:hypothetical protein R1sor_007515 [Riccia sorocarpa]|uniref:Uncharacterized protein n=1 Tax=Riccia sorocarpa TaxID=122646 RepID=A0ABD3HTA2_9MARC